MSLSTLTITRSFNPSVSYLRWGTQITYHFEAKSIAPGTLGLPVNMNVFRDKQIQTLVTTVVSATFKNQSNTSNNMQCSFSPTTGLTVNGLSGADIMFIPGTGVAKFDLVLVVEHGTNAGTIGPAFANGAQYEITMSNPEVPPYLDVSSGQWTCYNVGPPSR